MRIRLILVLLSILLLSSGWLGISGLPLIAALVPLLWISGKADSSRRAFWRVAGWCALTFGLWSVATTWWIWIASPAGAIMSPIITILLMGGSFMLYHYVSKRSSKVFSYTLLISTWIAAEYIYTVGEISFPWLTLGNGFANDIWLVQWYDTTGVFGGSLWALLCNVLIYEAALHRRNVKAIIVASAVILIPVVISQVKFHTYEQPEVKIRATVIQPNIECYTQKDELSTSEQVAIMTDLIRQSPADADYIITPESAIPNTIFEEQLHTSSAILPFKHLITSDIHKANIVIGASTARLYNSQMRTPTSRQLDEDEWYDLYNTVIAIDSTDHIQLRHKSLLVIGAEKTPYYRLLKECKFLSVDLGGVSGHLASDPEPLVFRSPCGTTTGAAICYEGIYGGYMTGFITRGAQMLFIISNDGWWGDTSGHRELFALSRLRAIELRRSIARSANTGKSGLIDPAGRVVESLGWDKRGYLSAELPLNGKITFYARYSDYIGRLASYISVLCMLYFIAYRVKRKDHLAR